MVWLRRFCFFTLLVCASAQNYTIQTIAGNDSVGDGGPATAAILSQAEGVAVDGKGNVYIADADENRVRIITSDGTVQTVAGNGQAGFAGDNGPSVKAQLNQPYGITLDSAGVLYIADLGNACVRKVGLDGVITTVAGSGALAPNLNGIPALSAKLIAPRNVAVDSNGALYISDFGANQVYRVATGTLVVVAGMGAAGFSGDGGNPNNAQLKSPAGLAFDSSGALYLADSGNNRIRKIGNGNISTVFNVPTPTGVATGPNGAVYVVSSSYFGTISAALPNVGAALDIAIDKSGTIFFSTAQQVRELTSSGAIRILAGSGASRYYGGDGGPATSARLNAPRAVLVDSKGSIYIADTGNNRIRRISANGLMETIAGTGQAGFAGDGASALNAQLNSPEALAFDSQGNLLIADTANNRIRKIDSAGIISTAVDQLKSPQAILMDQNGSMYISDTGNSRVVKIAAGGAASTVVTVQDPGALAWDEAGNLLIAVPSGLMRLTSSGLLVSVVDKLNHPAAIAELAGSGTFISESGAHKISRISASETLSLIAGNGTAGFTGDGGGATSAELNGPEGLAIGPDNTIYVADTGNNRIRALTQTAPVSQAYFPPEVTVVNSATLAGGAIAPGEIVTIFGAGFQDSKTSVTVAGEPAKVLYTNSTQINAVIPADLNPGGYAAIEIRVNGSLVGTTIPALAAAAPGLYTTASGSGPAAALNEDGTLNSATNPAARGSIIALYGTGASAANPVSVTIGQYPAEVTFAGPAPGFPGLFQINARVPGGFAPAGILPIQFSSAGIASQSGVTMAVK